MPRTNRGNDNQYNIPINRVGVLDNKDYNKRYSFYYDLLDEDEDEQFQLYDGERVYRCGRCGNLVDNYGNELFEEDKQCIAVYLMKAKNPQISYIYGKCCFKNWRPINENPKRI